jgi:hypothetical protein
MASVSITAGGINYNSPSLVGGTGTGVKIFPSLIAPTLPAGLQLTQMMQGQVFQITAAGTIFVHGVSPTIIPTLQYGNSLTSASNTTVAALTSAQSLSTAANYPWALQITMSGDNASGVIHILTEFWSCNGVMSSTLTNTLITGVNWLGVSSDGNRLPPVLPQFVFGINFTVSDALNTAAMYCWNIEY